MKATILNPICSLLDILLPQSWKQAVPVLVYHSISEHSSRITIAPDVFERQMAWLAQHGYSTIHPSEIMTPSTTKRIVITFDDGFGDNAAIAKPILDQYDFVATVFVSTDLIGKNSDHATRAKDQGRPMLTAEQIQVRAQGGWTIANHFASHRKLDTLSQGEVVEEYQLAATRLSELVDSPDPTIVCYPHNRFSDMVIETIQAQGATRGFVGKRGMVRQQENQFTLPRIEILSHMTMRDFALTLHPSFHFLRSLFGR